MIIKSLFLHNFRNFKKETFFFEPTFNAIIADNAQGKTNILEAIFFISTGRSFKNSPLQEMIKENEEFFYIEAEIIKDLVSQNIKIYFDRNKKKVIHNSTPLPSFTNLFGIFPSVIHSPMDIYLINGIPSIRRRFLNIHLAQKDPLYIYHLSRFHKALKQRNFLLKASKLFNIEIWEDELAKSASYIANARKNILKKLSEKLNDRSFLPEEVFIKYFPGFSKKKDIEESYLSYKEQLKKNRSKDLLLKSTQFGAHRDDFLIYLNKKSSKNFASEGQKRLLLLFLKLAEYDLLCEDIREKAILIIDDLGIHLDPSKLSLAYQKIEKLNQVIISTPVFEKNLSKNIIHISNGKIIKNPIS